MESISLADLFQKHAEDFKILQVCQFVTSDDTLYEFFYDDKHKKVILDVIRYKSTPHASRFTHQFADSNITMYDALIMYGLKNPKITFDDHYRAMIPEMPDCVYMGSPVNSLPLAQGKLEYDMF